MSEPLKSIHVRLSPEAHRVLAAISEIEDKDLAEMARVMLEQDLLGRVHTLTLAAKRYRLLGFSGISGELGGIRRDSE